MDARIDDAGTPRPADLPRRLVAEALGTAGLLLAVVGSGIMAERLAGGNAAIALLANSLATGFALMVLITALGSVSGAHLNPVVTLSEAWRGALPWSDAGLYVAVQVGGAFGGVGIANLMFELPVFFLSGRVRAGGGQFLAEVVATFGLLAVILACARRRPEALPFSVGAYIAGAYWFTASTSFANPAVTLARMASDTFTGIRPADVPAFVAAQLLGAAAATALLGWLMPVSPSPTRERR